MAYKANSRILSFKTNLAMMPVQLMPIMNATSDSLLTASQHADRSTATIVTETFFCVLIDVLALCGNAFVCLAVFRNSRLRSTTSIFIIALSISDILTAILCVPITAALLVTDAWIPGSFLCKLQGYAIHNLGMISVVTLALTAVNRFVRVKKPAMYRKIFTRRTSMWVLVVSWLAVILFYIGVLASGSTAVRYEVDYSVCAIAHVMSLIVFESSLVSLSLLVIVFSYLNVFNSIRRHQASVAASLQHSRSTLTTPALTIEEIKISKILFVTVLGFGLCWIPSMVIITLDRTVDGPVNPSRSATVFCIFLTYLNCAVNPVIYGVMNRSFRAEYKRIIMCKKTAPPERKPPTKFRQRVRLLMWTSGDKQRVAARRPDVQLDDISVPEAITRFPSCKQ